MAKPELKQFASLLPVDFDRHAIWISCHTSDYRESWYEETNEETFRPWNGPLPVSPADGLLLVRAVLVLADGSRFFGFVTPASQEGDLGRQQPHIFVGQKAFCFWGGVAGIPETERDAFYAALGRRREAIFPLRFSAELALTTGSADGRIDGFYRGSESDVRVET
jgi:hypothetical protein